MVGNLGNLAHVLTDKELDDSQMFKSGQKSSRKKAIDEMLYHAPRWKDSGCWPWPLYKNEKGYGVICFDGNKYSVHRLSFQVFKGIIPDGFVVMHECDNPACFNPDHLFLGTQQENMDDMVRKGRSRSGKTQRFES